MKFYKLLIKGTIWGLIILYSFGNAYGKTVTTTIYATLFKESGADSKNLAVGDQLVFKFSYDDTRTEMHSFYDNGREFMSWNSRTNPDSLFLSDADYNFSSNIELAIQEEQYDKTSTSYKSNVHKGKDFINFSVMDDNFTLNIRDYVDPSQFDTGQLLLYGNDNKLVTNIILSNITFSTTYESLVTNIVDDDMMDVNNNYPDTNNPDQADSDGDLIADAYDGCPNNPNKIKPDAYGCNDYISMGNNIEVSVCGEVKLIFDKVASSGFVECAKIPSQPANEFKSSSEGKNFKAISNAYDIDFTGAFRGFVTVCIGYNESLITERLLVLKYL